MIPSLYPCFQHWSKKGSVYLVSDTHFFDDDRELMGYNIPESVQLERISSMCHKNDTLIHLGDVGSVKWMNKIKAYKVLIMGNHDQSIEKMKKYFDEVYSGPLWISEKIVLSHEPLILEECEYGIPIAFNIHGHDHSGKNRIYTFHSMEDSEDTLTKHYHFNIAQNIFGYTPLNLKKFIESGILKDKWNIHRTTIELAKAKKEHKEILNEWFEDTGAENV